jgi:Fur family ferric uptake transcriptional regulator
VTATHTSPPAGAPTASAAIAALRSSGLRLSSARRLLVDALFAADGPVSAERIAAGLGGRVPPADLASVYRNLETLERVGLVRHVHLRHGPALYAPAGQGEREYLACERCDDVRAVSPEELDDVRQLVRERFGYEARFSHFPLVGLCEECARTSGAAETDRAEPSA